MLIAPILDLVQSIQGQWESLLPMAAGEAQKKQQQVEGGIQILVPFLLSKLGLIDTSDTEALRQATIAQAQTSQQLQGTLQAELRGERTPAVDAISRQLRQAFRGQRQAAAASASRQGVAGTRVASAMNQRLNEQFSQMLSDLLAQNYTRAQGLAAGQGGIQAGSQQFLSQMEQQQIGEVSAGLGSILGNATYQQDPQLKRIYGLLIQQLQMQMNLQMQIQGMQTAQQGTQVRQSLGSAGATLGWAGKQEAINAATRDSMVGGATPNPWNTRKWWE